MKPVPLDALGLICNPPDYIYPTPSRYVECYDCGRLLSVGVLAEDKVKEERPGWPLFHFCAKCGVIRIKKTPADQMGKPSYRLFYNGVKIVKEEVPDFVAHLIARYNLEEPTL